jgi:phosphoribosyl-ATP pyrophosphohydrolase/phosphoribosyl-AMP cyclohydrolase
MSQREDLGRPLAPADIDKLDFSKGAGLIPAIVQHAATGAVLMMAYMNREALGETLTRGRVVFFSRSKQRLWEKGESSGHTLDLVAVRADCDLDTLLVTALPRGPACHLGATTCFGDEPVTQGEQLAFLGTLQDLIERRIAERPDGSYTARLFAEGTRRVSQKVGEEGVELALATAGGPDDEVIGEAADLLFHTLLALRSRGLRLERVIEELRSRQRAKA